MSAANAAARTTTLRLRVGRLTLQVDAPPRTGAFLPQRVYRPSLASRGHAIHLTLTEESVPRPPSSDLLFASFEMIPVLEAKAILSLAATKDGVLYGITDNEKVFVFDVEKRLTRVVMDLEFKEPTPAYLHLGLDERLYGLAKEAIFAIDPKNDRISLLIKPSVPIVSGMAMLGRKIYFGSGASLWEFEIPAEKIIE